MKEFSTIKNEKTGSVFHMIGAAPNDLIGSVRIWSEASATKSKSIFLFRFRVERDSDAPASLVDFKSLVGQTLPQAAWDSGSKAHVSVSGAIEIDRPLWNLEGVLEALSGNDVFGQIFDGLSAMMAGMSFYCDRDEFTEFMAGQVVNIITNGSADSTSEVATVVVSLLDKKLKLQGGAPVESASEQEPQNNEGDQVDNSGLVQSGATAAADSGEDHASMVGL